MTRHYFIERADVAEDIAILKEAEEKFWRSIQTGERTGLILPEI